MCSSSDARTQTVPCLYFGLEMTEIQIERCPIMEMVPRKGRKSKRTCTSLDACLEKNAPPGKGCPSALPVVTISEVLLNKSDIMLNKTCAIARNFAIAWLMVVAFTSLTGSCSAGKTETRESELLICNVLSFVNHRGVAHTRPLCDLGQSYAKSSTV